MSGPERPTATRRWHKGKKVPVVGQMSMTECGAACLSMVVTAHGRYTSTRECRDLLDIGRDGADGAKIAQVARRMGLEVRAFSTDLPHLAELALPAVLYWNFSHYVVLERWRTGRYVIVDPAIGRRSLDEEEFSRGFTGIAMEMTPGPDFEPRRSTRGASALQFARGLLSISRPLLLRVLCVSLLLQLMLLLPALATKFTVDTLIGQQQAGLLPMFGLALGLMLLTNTMTGYARSIALVHLHTQVDQRLMQRFFRHLLDLPYRYFQLRGTGDLAMRLSSNATVREVVTGQTLSVVVDGAFVGVYLVLVMLAAPAYGGVVLALGALQFVAILASFRFVRDLVTRDVTTQAQSQGYLIEALQGMETVKATGAEENVYTRWSSLLNDQLVASLRRRVADGAFEALFSTIRSGTPLLLLCFGARQVLNGEMSLGDMLALNTLAAALLGPLGQLATTTRQLQLVGSHLDRMRDVLEEEVEQDRSRVDDPGTLDGHVELRAVSFRYGGSEALAADGVSLTVRAGMKVALVGRTGSGKSTLAKIILGLYHPTEGTVYHDGRPLNQLDLRKVRGQCGVVMQEPAFFVGSVRDNIAFGEPTISLEDVVSAARLAQIHEDIALMPMGYETLIAEGGSGLSGGQRQRLALARALVRRPGLLVLDEATSHLDVVTERAVDDVLSTLSCTRVVIAHRLSTVRNADLIVVLDNGRIVERGTHRELLEAGGTYQALVRDQLHEDPATR
ncbi:peptidase domain-containing ABC transporter [Streptomyces sp. A012304]|uniref:peptidase domain-containing ABC transporter n=1 Tax=Streptomyces sp. A012304 TaxID=375446 RepID=UPI00222E6754|nr:peptidase domain-containing ABC transporter [Streptomyces sp. A012304]GKQ36404.1 NHLP family bacteriocin export ABC transporter peptidase/permease/ATPase [Streptomyces sp. A012304]